MTNKEKSRTVKPFINRQPQDEDWEGAGGLMDAE